MGRAKDCRQHGERALELADDLGLRSIIHLVGSALGRLELGLGRCEAAIEHLEVVRQFSIDVGLEAPSITPWAQNLAEAYIRLDQSDRAQPVLTMLERQAKRSGGTLALGSLPLPRSGVRRR